MLKIYENYKRFLEESGKENAKCAEEVAGSVKEIIDSVRKQGDSALVYYTEKFDRVKLKENELKVGAAEIAEARKKITAREMSALKAAKRNIEKFCRKQLPKEWKIETEKGVTVGEIIRPVETAGIYVPAGRFPLASSVLMNAIPAKVAGCKRIVLCSPPNREGKISPAILAAAGLCGVDSVFRCGGAQAIAAMAYGTETIPAVNKIVGPGNIFVSTAKRLVYGKVDIDFFAGPSEIAIIADSGNAEIIAADMLAQAEHDALSRAVLITRSRKLAEEVEKELGRQLRELPSNETAQKALEENGAIVLVKNMQEAADAANAIAPEHLEIWGEEKLLGKINNAGAIFLGQFSPVVAGDYASGSNHVLPTAGFAKSRAGLSSRDFVKAIAFQKISKKGLRKLGGTIETMASMEGLEAHRRALEKRLKRG